MARHRHNIGASRRRRREDEGEDEGSLDGEVEDDSLSEGSVVSQQDDDEADGEGSDSEDDNTSVDGSTNNHINSRVLGETQESQQLRSVSPKKPALATTMSDTDAMMNGLQLGEDGKDVTEVHFHNMSTESDQSGRTPSAPPPESARAPSTEARRRGNEKNTKEKGADPTAVPMRGSFFLHDKRLTAPGTNGQKIFSKSAKSKPFGLIVDGNVRRKPDITTEGPWTHDLHDTVAGDDPPAPKHSATMGPATTFPHKSVPTTVPTAPKSTTPPNRSFSSTVVVGNVPVVVYLPGMTGPVSTPISKKQHTCLPHHRPPLRRDKPVRISIPGQPVKYMFPATERSFIFIPRANRPNQQAYRGRGRGGFYGGRRQSFYASSTYTPSVAMSRRSSFGKPPSLDGFHSPASMLSRHTVVTTESGKPVVRLPPRPPGTNSSAAAAPLAMNHPPTQPQSQQPVWRESRPAPIPMHQPRPQKAVSLADIETPASFPFNPPPAQQDQAFQHQIPMPGSGPPYGSDTSNTYPPSAHTAATPLSQIPERAVHAPPFQAYGYQQPQPFYAPPYPSGPVYYPVSGTEYGPYNNPGAGPGVPFTPGQNVPYMGPAAAHTSAEPTPQTGTVAHEAGGTVYYYDASQIYPGPNFGVPSVPAGGAVGMGGMMTPGTTYYYPQPQGVYYTPQ
ncbi:CASC3/Barentsz eIF4AIII binding-domain-containing protein [Aspergillus egyptiacus]|nr:CASC3/Barentsz eIF4AIII binding-domain-containing protein [Aspergillus egyptiacus]